MSVFDYKKYKISLRHDSKKTQGLKTGDIVRRQYFDGKNLIYSLLCVMDHGVDEIIDANKKDLDTAKANGNNVDAETEANNILQIQMQYKLLTQLTNFEFSQLSIAMK